MKYPRKRTMYLAPEIPALSATFVYNEIFDFAEHVSPVVIASVHRPKIPANEGVFQRLGDRVFYLYGRSVSERVKALAEILNRHPMRFLHSVRTLLSDMFRVGITSRTAKGLVYRFVYAAILAKKMECCEADHLHVHFAHIPTDLAMYASLMTGIPFSITGHANDIFERGWLLPQKAARAHFFATISDFNRRALIEMGCDAEKVEVVRCGIDPTLFQYREPTPSSVSPLRIGSLGRLVVKKGFHTLLDACSILATREIEFQLDIAGDGPLADQLKTQAKEKEIMAKTQFLGALSHDQVSDWIRDLDVFVLACCEDENGDVDGIPVVLMEAMAMGVPVISTNVTGLPELVIADETGLVGVPLDAHSIAEQLEKISASPDLTKQLAARAKAHVDEHFTQQANVEKLGDLIFSNS